MEGELQFIPHKLLQGAALHCRTAAHVRPLPAQPQKGTHVCTLAACSVLHMIYWHCWHINMQVADRTQPSSAPKMQWNMNVYLWWMYNIILEAWRRHPIAMQFSDGRAQGSTNNCLIVLCSRITISGAIACAFSFPFTRPLCVQRPQRIWDGEIKTTRKTPFQCGCGSLVAVR